MAGQDVLWRADTARIINNPDSDYAARVRQFVCSRIPAADYELSAVFLVGAQPYLVAPSLQTPDGDFHRGLGGRVETAPQTVPVTLAEVETLP